MQYISYSNSSKKVRNGTEVAKVRSGIEVAQKWHLINFLFYILSNSKFFQ